MAKRNNNLDFLAEAKAEVEKIKAGATDDSRLMKIFSLMTDAEVDAYNAWFAAS